MILVTVSSTIVGIDFDNTIVSYDRVFHAVAVERALVPPELPASKFAVRNYLCASDREDTWTEMQGFVYGARMEDAEMYPGVLEFLRWARSGCVKVAVISHKTRYPFLGPRYDLHEAARNWVQSCLVDAEGPLVPREQVYFELTKEEKLARIAYVGCEAFIDDLPEILLAEIFPASASRFLFDPEGHHVGVSTVQVFRSWTEILVHVRDS